MLLSICWHRECVKNKTDREAILRHSVTHHHPQANSARPGPSLRWALGPLAPTLCNIASGRHNQLLLDVCARGQTKKTANFYLICNKKAHRHTIWAAVARLRVEFNINRPSQSKFIVSLFWQNNVVLYSAVLVGLPLYGSACERQHTYIHRTAARGLEVQFKL
jgi:hypothetical protein